MARLFKAAAAAALLLRSVAAIDPPREPHQPVGGGDRIVTWNETVVSPRFGASSRSVSWLSGAEDGRFIYLSDSALVIEDIVSGANETFVAADKIPADYAEYWIRPDLKKVLFATNYTKQYRYSYFADYSVLDVESGALEPLVADQAGDIQYAEFSPVGDAIVFVRGNNLFLSRNGTVSQITNDGGPDMFHGVPDWVYEEEIFGSRSTFWFSPDGEYVAYLSFNETGVETFTIPYFMGGDEVAPPYPVELDLRYPKVGSKNPTVELTVLEVASGTLTPVAIEAFPADDLVVGELKWVTDAHASFVYRAFNRVQDQEKIVRVDVEGLASQTVRERDGTDGWLDNNLGIEYLGPLPNGTDAYYLDMSDESGWNHLYLHPVKGGAAIPLTSGEWEVTAVLKIDTERRLIYYLSTEHHSTERHLYSVSYPSGTKKALVDDSVAGYWSASFSASGGYYILSYQGPNVPYQELYSVNSTTPVRTITSNEALVTRLQDYKLPNITYLELVHPDGYTLNVMQRLPANFDPSKKYPALFTPYGGPGAQEVTKRHQSINWRAFIASDPELEYITYTVDNRGTGYKGRAFRSAVAGHLGRLEPLDQIWAAEQLSAQNAFVDAGKIGIFGWSYGGYLAAKVLEADSGVFSSGLIVAPVSDWRFYDSLYTERYMKTLETNEEGYNETAVRRPEGFKNLAGEFTIFHGTGDDNVHYQNAAALIDMLVGAGVPHSKMNWLAFTDSDHGITYNGASAWLYKYMTEALYREKRREGEELVHQWSKKSEGF
ncbi:extracellular dipeptidyl-peptidase dpp4 [Colletotrichum sojae]|uniref:Probable dipeptidyl-aminopeptidase B n=1 Tax=Colletotrichum sojae TaxID=2175907 RepID=A0A8H6MNW7_9PEZI|nr:extracellular dipeptidyl-peptidase dpp4 [Colletotrichum sojae]